MMLGVCRGLYNTTMNVKCRRDNIEGIKCTCPDCESFLQMCYLYNLYKTNSISLCFESQTGDIGNNLLQCSRCIIEDEMCQDEKWCGQKIVNMQLDETKIKHEWERFAVLPRDDREDLLFLLFLLLTMSLNYKEKSLCLADVICVYDESILEKRFSKMINKFIQDVWASLEGYEDSAKAEATKDLQRISAFLHNINFIYSKRKEIYDQANHYLDCFCLGTERRGKTLEWKSMIKSNFSTRLKKDNLDRELESFLFLERESFLKKRFYHNIVAVKLFANKCQEFYQMFSQEDLDEFLDMLGQYHCEIAGLTEIRGLERATFTSKESFKADSKLILDFLRKKVDVTSKCQRVEEFCWNAWESALA